MAKMSSGLSADGQYRSTLYQHIADYKRKRGYRSIKYWVFIERTDGKKEETNLGDGLIVPCPRVEYLEPGDELLWIEAHKLRPTD